MRGKGREDADWSKSHDDYLRRFSKEDIINLFKYGVPEKDDKGHFEQFSVRIHPFLHAYLNRLAERLDKYHTTKSACFRIITARFATLLMQECEDCFDDDDFKDIKFMLDSFKKLGYKQQLKDLSDEVNRYNDAITHRDDYDPYGKDKDVTELLGHIRTLINKKRENLE